MGVIKEPCVQNIWKNGTWLGAKDTFLKSTLHKMSKHILLNWQCKGQHAMYKRRFDFADPSPLFGQKILFWGFSNLINCWDITTASCSVITIMDRYKANFVWINSEKRLELQKTPCPLHHILPLEWWSFMNSPMWCSRYFAEHSKARVFSYLQCVRSCRLITCAIKEENKIISMHSESCCWRFC